MANKTVFITGANRGIGLALAGRYLDDGDTVIATCRDGSDAALAELAAAQDGRLEVFPLDVRDTARIAAIAGDLAGRPIDILINNAGAMGASPEAQSFGAAGGTEEWIDAFRTNAIAPFRLAGALVANLGLGVHKKIINVSSIMASMGAPIVGGYYQYRSTKAALNAITVGEAMDLKERGITVVSLHPGLVRTRMGGEDAPTTPAQAASKIAALVERLSLTDSGRFYNIDGSELAW